MAGRDLDRGRFLIPDPITVTLTRPDATASGGLPSESVTVERVQEQHETEETIDSPLGGTLGGVTRTFHLWFVECGGLEPGQDWLIEQASDGTAWRVTSVEKLAHGRRFRCKCIRKNT